MIQCDFDSFARMGPVIDGVRIARSSGRCYYQISDMRGAAVCWQSRAGRNVAPNFDAKFRQSTVTVDDAYHQTRSETRRGHSCAPRADGTEAGQIGLDLSISVPCWWDELMGSVAR